MTRIPSTTSEFGSEEVFPLNPDSADLCAIGRAKSPKSNQGENMPPGGIIVITAGAASSFQNCLTLSSTLHLFMLNIDRTSDGI